MSQHPTSRSTSQLLPYSSHGTVPASFSRREARELAQSQNKEVARGITEATRLMAAGYVAGVGIQLCGMLSREAEFQAVVTQDPQAAARADFILNSFAETAGRAVRGFEKEL